jgi:hypothetical protein
LAICEAAVHHQWTSHLDAAHHEFADGLAANPAVRIEQQNGCDRIILTGLDRLDEPASLIELHKDVAARMPAVDLPEMGLEVDSTASPTAAGSCCGDAGGQSLGGPAAELNLDPQSRIR